VSCPISLVQQYFKDKITKSRAENKKNGAFLFRDLVSSPFKRQRYEKMAALANDIWKKSIFAIQMASYSKILYIFAENSDYTTANQKTSS
jgi:hypothetical protein